MVRDGNGDAQAVGGWNVAGTFKTVTGLVLGDKYTGLEYLWDRPNFFDPGR